MQLPFQDKNSFNVSIGVGKSTAKSWQSLNKIEVIYNRLKALLPPFLQWEI